MVSRAFKLRVRRRVRLRQRQVEAFGLQAEEQLENNLFRRLGRFRDARRFILTWLMLIVLLGGCIIAQSRALNGYYKTPQPAAGGTLNEGIIGSFTNANPVYATSAVDLAVSRLIFAGLYKYDSNNQLVGDLADGPWAVDATGMQYTVHLRSGLTWQDGKPLTAQDVAFTFHVIQNADAQSPYNAAWQGVTVTAVNATTVTFALPDPLASFPYSLTMGIIPQHILGNTSMAEMRTATFNTANPVGAGPFSWSAIEVAANNQVRIALKPFQEYNSGAPKLNGFVIHTFRDQQGMTSSFKNQEINAMSGLTEVPQDVKNARSYSMPLTAAVMTFFKTSEGILSDTAVRQALVQGTDTNAIISSLGYPARAVREPLLQGQAGYDSAYFQASYSQAAAEQQLDAAGWKLAADGIRYKDKQPLTFGLYAENTSEYAKVGRQLQRQWKALGVKVDLQLQDTDDFQSTLTFHSYDALLYGISIGKDPDVYAYWSSAQADVRAVSRLNFSEYRSVAADSSLEAGRTRNDPALRAVKYKGFLQAWQKDAPALGLYQPRYLYVSRSPIFNLQEHYLNTAADIYGNVNEWMIRQTAVPQTSVSNE
ncbi:MAG TPA: peptide ABC transporter substrate-binding protein [Candidatus Saccharimonadales bacterium]|nr:peptide ABC transporter substrate-binding protein [Candidatus Saccharimonadales bacterium]